MPVISHFLAAASQLRASFRCGHTRPRITHSTVRSVQFTFRSLFGRALCSNNHLTSTQPTSKKLSLPVRMPRLSRRTASTSALGCNEAGVLKTKRALKRDLDAHSTPKSESPVALSKKIKQEDDVIESSLLQNIKVEGIPPQDFALSFVGIDTCDEKVAPISITKRRRSVKQKKESGNESVNTSDTITYTRRSKAVKTEAADTDTNTDTVPSLQPAEVKSSGKATKNNVRVTKIDSPYRNKRSRPSKPKSEARNTAIPPASQLGPLALIPKQEPVGVIRSTPAATAVVIKLVPNGSPFPGYVRPYPEECREVTRRLAMLHGWDIEDNRACPTLPPDQKETLRSTDSGAETNGTDPESNLESRLPNEVSAGPPAGSQVKGSEEVLFPGSDAAWALEVARQKEEEEEVVKEGVKVKQEEEEEEEEEEEGRGGGREDGRVGGRAVQVVLKKVVAGWARFGVLDSLVRTILSQNTTDKNASRAYAALKIAFPSWEDVHAADPTDLESTIRCGGLAEIKGKRIKEILATLQSERGEISLEYLHEMSTDEIKAELGRFKGVGPKTVACVLMFHMLREEFPVDTHVFRITKSLGWVPQTADRERTYLHLNQRIPDDCKYALHCLLVTHGKHCPNCAKKFAQRAPVGPCPLVAWGKEHIKYREVERLEQGEKVLAIEG